MEHNKDAYVHGKLIHEQVTPQYNGERVEF